MPLAALDLDIILEAESGQRKRIQGLPMHADLQPGSGETAKSFADLLTSHLNRGTRPRPKGQREWKLKDFAREVGVAYNTVRNWCGGANPPPHLANIETALFGANDADDDDQYRMWRNELRTAYQNIQKAKLTVIAIEKEERRQPRNIPFLTLGSLFKGRDGVLAKLRNEIIGSDDGASRHISVRAIYGFGGIGKTRLAVEYALRHAKEYSALLFVRAGAPGELDASFAELTQPGILDILVESEQQDVQIAAVFKWLEGSPNWLLIVDNVDDPEACGAVEKILTKLSGGHVLITGRSPHFSAPVRQFELDVLDIGNAAEFLLERTQAGRERIADDVAIAHELASQLGCLPLGLEQAGAYIAKMKITLGRYLFLWKEKREKIIYWFDPQLMNYDRDTGLASTWAISVDHLSTESRRLLLLIAYMGELPIPTELLDCSIPEDSFDCDLREACADLFAYSLVSRVTFVGGPKVHYGLIVHPLLLDFLKRTTPIAQNNRALLGAFTWANEFIGTEWKQTENFAMILVRRQMLLLLTHIFRWYARYDDNGDPGLNDPSARTLYEIMNGPNIGRIMMNVWNVHKPDRAQKSGEGDRLI